MIGQLYKIVHSANDQLFTQPNVNSVQAYQAEVGQGMTHSAK